MSLQLSAAKLLLFFDICKGIVVKIEFAQKNLHFLCRFFLSPFPKSTEAALGEGTNSYFAISVFINRHI